MKKNNMLYLRIILFFISIIITWVQADEIRVPNFSWEKINVISNKGEDLPEGRRDYAIGYCRDKNEVIIFGGRNFDDKVLGDTWIFNIDSNKWRKPRLASKETDVQPPSRYGMVYGNDQPPSNSYRNAFVITGGKGSNGEFYNDVWSFDFINECWVEINAKGDKPEPRYESVGGINLTLVSHLNQLSSVYLILSHGRNDSKHFNDTYILKLDGRSQQGDYSQLSAEWKKLNTKNAPVLKNGPTGNVLSNDRLVVFGGCENVNNKNSCDGKGYILNINFDYLKTEVVGETVWQEVSNDCIRPKGYATATRGSDLSSIDLTENDRLVIFGGVTEAKYGEDADGDISIFDMDKRKFFGVHPSSKSNNNYPKATEGGKMVTTYPKLGEKGYSIILLSGEPITKEEEWYSNIWRLIVLDSDTDYTYYPEAPTGNTITDCYTIKDVKKDSSSTKSVDDISFPNETILSFISFVLGYMIGIPALVTFTRAMNCFSNKWPLIILIMGAISLSMAGVNIFTSSFLILKIVVIGLLLIYLILAILRPKDLTKNDNVEVTAAGVPVVSVKGKAKLCSDRHSKELDNAISTTVLINPSTMDKTNAAAPEINVNFETDSFNVPTQSSSSIFQMPNDGDNNNNNKSTVSAVMINPSLKNTQDNEADFDDESNISEIKDEFEAIKERNYSRYHYWIITLRGFGVILLIAVFTTVFLLAFNNDSRLSKIKFLVFIWIAVVIVIYFIAMIIFAKSDTSGAVLKAKRTSFRRSEPLEPNQLSNAWATIPVSIPLGDVSEISTNASISVFDDVGNVSSYSSNKINNSISTAPTLPSNTSGVNAPSSVPTRYSFPTLPVNNIYINNQGQFSVQPNFNTASQTPPTISSSLINQPIDSTIYRASEVVQPSLSFSSSLDPLVTTLPSSDEPVIGGSSRVTPKPSSNSQYLVHSSINKMNVQFQDQQIINDNGQYLPSLPVVIPSSPLYDESIQIDMEGTKGKGGEEAGSIGTLDEFPQRSETVENINNKEVMMVMTVPKRKLAIVNE